MTKDNKQKSFEEVISFIEDYLGIKLLSCQKEMIKIIYNENIK